MGGFFKKNKIVRALQHREHFRELWALMKRACLNYPTAPAIKRSNPQSWSHCSCRTLAAPGGGWWDFFKFSFSPSNRNTKRRKSNITSRFCSCIPGSQSRRMLEFLSFHIQTSRKWTRNSGIIWKEAVENHAGRFFFQLWGLVSQL